MNDALAALAAGALLLALGAVLLWGCGPSPCDVPCGTECCPEGYRCDRDREVYSCALRGLP